MPEPIEVLRAGLANRYRLGSEIGRGGMATVYEAEDLTDSRRVAIKVLREELAHVLGPQRFLREIRIVGKLKHESIVPLLDSGEVGGLLYLVMPFIEGETLRQRIRRETHLTVEDAIRITCEIAAGLEHAHEQGVIHRDIKPENVLFDNGRAVVADFGVARVMDSVDEETLSTTGLALGTPKYMSPEQASGLRTIDGRSDIYSLGCLLYEMLAGEPPFTGPTPQAVTARHMLEPPPQLRVVRPAIGIPLQAAIEKALAKIPSDRFQSATDLGRALRTAANEPAPEPASNAHAPVSRRLRYAASAVAVTAAGLTWALLWWPRPVAARIAVLPCSVSGTVVTSLSVERCTRLLWGALREWSDLDLVDIEDVLNEEWATAGAVDLRANGGRIARAHGAGSFVSATIGQTNDTLWIAARLHVPPGLGLRDGRASIAAPVRSVDTRDNSLLAPFRSLARGLLLTAASDTTPHSMMGVTSHFSALRSAIQGDSAMLEWSLPLAKERYQNAFTIDPDYAVAKLKYARASLWEGTPAAEWAPVARAAAAASDLLDPPARAEVEALVYLGERDFERACFAYQALIAADSTSYAGWFGLGECLLQDTVVVADPSSPSGLRFRGSLHAGLQAYRTAMVKLPLTSQAFGGPLLARMSQRLMTHPSDFRVGAIDNPTGSAVAAFPELRDDTLALHPYPLNEVLTGRRMPATHGEALAVTRRTFLSVTREWRARYPSSTAAALAHAVALELVGQLTDSVRGRPSALSVIRALRAASPAGSQDVQLAASEIRLLVKLMRIDEAVDTALRVLRQEPRTAADGRQLAALAAFVGRTNLAAALFGRYGNMTFVTGDGAQVSLPAPIAEDANRLLVYAASGGPRDSILAIQARLRSAIEISVPEPDRAGAIAAAELRPRLLSFPVLSVPMGNFLPAASLATAIERGDTANARGMAATLADMRKHQIPGTVGPEWALVEARLFLVLGDTVRAEEQLVRLRAGWGSLGDDIVADIPPAAAVARVLILQRKLGLLPAIWSDSTHAAFKPD